MTSILTRYLMRSILLSSALVLVVLLALAVLVRLDRVVERGLHLLGRLRVLDGDRVDGDAGLVAFGAGDQVFGGAHTAIP